jgi:hypothetical protein
MVIGTVCHSQGMGRFACAQAGCQYCLETLLRENKGLIQSVIQTQGMGGDRLCGPGPGWAYRSVARDHAL